MDEPRRDAARAVRPSAAPRRRTRLCLPRAGNVLAVCAHPDDESFGLGAVLAAFSGQGARVRVLCFTHGESSTLGLASRSLGEVRAEELRAAAAVLGAELLSYPDGNLAGFPAGELAGLAGDALTGADLLLVFDQGGITGHPDHCQATAAALLAARRHQLPVLAWALPEEVAAQLNAEFGTTFAGRPHSQLDIVIDVDRARQRSAIACHPSQSADNPVLWRRLELLGAGPGFGTAHRHPAVPRHSGAAVEHLPASGNPARPRADQSRPARRQRRVLPPAPQDRGRHRPPPPGDGRRTHATAGTALPPPTRDVTTGRHPGDPSTRNLPGHHAMGTRTGPEVR